MDEMLPPTPPAGEPGAPPRGPHAGDPVTAQSGPPGAPPGQLGRWMSDSVGKGVATALILPFVFGLLALSCLVVPVIGQILCWIFGFSPGISQLLYIVPLQRWAKLHEFARLRKGLLIGASIVFLLNSACWGTMLLTLNRSLR